ncbi:MAG: hypothetical protein KAJ44_03070 [Thermoplasmatales archaeon]|nr:hypothetical protein [Thermoplasmatales archaeon]
MPDLNIFNLDFGNLAKLLNQGRVDKVYNKMYTVAHDLSVHELKQYLTELRTKASSEKTGLKLLTLITDFKKERISFHMNEMKQLLDKSLKMQSKED